MELIELLKVAPFSGKRVSFFEGEKRYLSTSDLLDDEINFVNVTFINRPSRADIEVKEGDILFARMKETNKVLYIDKSLSGIIVSTGFSVHRANKNIDSQYLVHIFRHNIFNRQKDKFCTGAIQPAITNTGLKKIKIPIPYKDGKPDLLTQKRIAKILSHTEALIAKRKKSIQMLDELVKATFLEMFGDPRINPKNWDIFPVIKFSDCIVPGRDKPKNFSGNIPWVTTNDLNYLGTTYYSKQGIGLSDKEIKEVNARIIPKGSVLMTCVGDLGNVSIAGDNIVVNQQLHTFQCDLNELNNVFLMYVLSYKKQYMYKMASKTTVPYMNKQVCNSIPIIKPPIYLQNQFAEIVKKTEALKKQFEQSLQELQNLYGSLSQSAFKGELDLSRVEIEEIEEPEQKVETMDKEIKKEEMKKLNLIEFIREKFNNEKFSFEELKELIEKDGFDYEYEKIKKEIFQSIDDERINQVFDEQTGSIKLRLNNETYKA